MNQPHRSRCSGPGRVDRPIRSASARSQPGLVLLKDRRADLEPVFIVVDEDLLQPFHESFLDNDSDSVLYERVVGFSRLVQSQRELEAASAEAARDPHRTCLPGCEIILELLNRSLRDLDHVIPPARKGADTMESFLFTV
jgi:hypothetical protein